MLRNPDNDPALEAVRSAFSHYYSNSSVNQLEAEQQMQASNIVDTVNEDALKPEIKKLEEKAEVAKETRSRRARQPVKSDEEDK